MAVIDIFLTYCDKPTTVYFTNLVYFFIDSIVTESDTDFKSI